MDILTALESLSALSHETRLWVFRLLVQAGREGMSAGEIAEALSSRQNTLSSHLAKLTDAALISRRRQGRRVIYQAAEETMRELAAFLHAEVGDGESDPYFQ